MPTRYSPTPSTGRWAIPILVAIWILWGFGYETVWQRLSLQLEGTVVSSRDVSATGAPRYATYYVVRANDGRDQTYVAGATDSDLQRSMPVGTQIHKVRGQLDYRINGQRVGFPTTFYGAFLCLAVLLVGLGAKGWWNERKRGRPDV